MTAIKGPAIDSASFRVEGHCCGIRIPALMDPSSTGVQFEMSPEVRAELFKAGIALPDLPPKSPGTGELAQPAGVVAAGATQERDRTP